MPDNIKSMTFYSAGSRSINQTTVKGHSGFFGKDNLTFRQFKKGVPLSQIRGSFDSNRIDEILLQDKEGNYYVVYADELSPYPNKGDQAEVNGITLTVVETFNAVNEEYVIAGGAVVAGVAFAGLGALAMGGAISAGSAATLGAGAATAFAVGEEITRTITDYRKEDPSAILALTIEPQTQTGVRTKKN